MATQQNPLFSQVEETLKDMIEGDRYSPGDQIPSERELSEELGISRMTVRKAMENLTRLGLLERRSTKGTFVARRPVGRIISGESDGAYSLSQLLSQEGAKAGSKLLSFVTALASLKIATRLKIRLGSTVFVITRVRTVNDVPFSIETSYIPAVIAPGLTVEHLDSQDASLYKILGERYNIFASKSDKLLELTYTTQAEAEILGLHPGDPAFLLRSLIVDENEKPIEYCKSINNPKLVDFRTTFKYG